MDKYNRPVRYSLAMFGLSVMGYMYTAFGTAFYTIDLPLTLEAIAFGRILFAIWDVFNDPIAGYLSDRTRSRWGRRKPWLVVSVVIFMLSSALFFTPPASLTATSSLSLAVYFTIFLMLTETAQTIATVNYHSLLPELFREEKDRNKANSIRQALQIVGMIIGVALVPMIASAIGYSMTAILLTIIGGGVTIYSVLGCREQKEFSDMPQPALWESIKAIAGNPNFWHVSLSHLCYGAASDILMMGMPFYLMFALQLDRGVQTYMMAAVFVTAIPAMLVWYRLINRFGTLKVWRIALIWLLFALIPFYFVTSIIASCIVGIFVGVGLSGIIANLDMVASELIEEDARKYGVRREATYFAGMSFIRRCTSLISSAALFIMVYLFNFRSGEDPGPNAGSASRFLMVLVPICLMALAVGFSFLARIKPSPAAEPEDSN